MAPKHKIGVIAVAFLLFSTIMDSRAAGILTDRLSPRQMQTWRLIENTVFAGDSAGIPLHPILQSLWKQVETNDLRIYIEMPEPDGPSPYSGGSFRLVRLMRETIEKATRDTEVAVWRELAAGQQRGKIGRVSSGIHSKFAVASAFPTQPHAD